MFIKIMTKLARHFGMSMETVFGLARAPNRSTDIVLFAHSLLDFDLAGFDYRGVHFVRDPRDVWVSGYLYHRRCKEEWCVNTALIPIHPIRYPQVPVSLQHRPESWKKAYLEGLGGKSYQQNLLDLDQRNGLAFELDRYAAWTIEAMSSWEPRPGEILETQMEAFAKDFDGTMAAILSHLGFADDRLAIALQIAATEDTSRMDDRRIKSDPHIHSRKLSKWRDFLGAEQLKVFEARHSMARERLRYPNSPGLPA
jgi:hypothetical protein